MGEYMKTRLIFVRHAEAEGNFTRVFQGWTDGELTPKGHLQARLAAEKLRTVEIDVLYSSSLKRTLQTAQCISDIKNLPIIRTDKLKEINGGDWEGQRWEDLPGKWPYEYDTWENKIHVHQMPNGESMIEFQQRLIDEVKYIAGDNTGKNICIVTHGTAIRSLMAYFRHKELDEMQNIPWYDNTSITIVDFENDKFKLILEGDASHLDKEMSTLENQDWWSEHIEKIKEK
jgi:broad specificity phosphatase PhoE